VIERFANYLWKGTEIREKLNYMVKGDVYGTEVLIKGFADPKDGKLDGQDKEYYDEAMKDYRTLIDSFSGEKINALDENQETFGEKALSNAIKLAEKAGQKKSMVNLCKEFKERYPKLQNQMDSLCGDDYKNANAGVSSHSINVNGFAKDISFEGIYEPTTEEYGVEIIVTGAGDYSGSKILRKELVWKKNSVKINLNDFRVIGKNNYNIRVTKINLKKQARVSVIPKINNAGTEANFSFNIGIEKRAIQLSPEKIKERLETVNDSIEKWTKISDNLDTAVRGFKAACLTTGTALTIKNFFGGFGGKSIAREEVMRGEGGWVELCKAKIEDKSDKDFYEKSLDYCLLEYSDEIDSDVDVALRNIENQNENPIKEENVCERLEKISEGLSKEILTDPYNSAKSIDATKGSNVYTVFNANCSDRKISLSQARDIERYNAILEDASAR
jgi:hypothetical protein